MYTDRIERIELSNGQIVEVLRNRKDAIEFIRDCYVENKDYLDDDSSLYVEYKDGSHYYLSGSCEEGKFKRTGIKTVIEDNPCTYTVYGKWVLIKTDDNEDDKNCCYVIAAM